MEQQIQSYKLIAITNLESYFKRDNVIDENYSKASNVLDLNISKSFDKDDEFSVILTVDLKQQFEGKNLVEIKVRTAGTFKSTHGIVTEDSSQVFCAINAPAIIFPFVRELISNLSTRGNIQPIIIQPINFVELSKKDPQQSKK